MSEVLNQNLQSDDIDEKYIHECLKNKKLIQDLKSLNEEKESYLKKIDSLENENKLLKNKAIYLNEHFESSKFNESEIIQLKEENSKLKKNLEDCSKSLNIAKNKLKIFRKFRDQSVDKITGLEAEVTEMNRILTPTYSRQSPEKSFQFRERPSLPLITHFGQWNIEETECEENSNGFEIFRSNNRKFSQKTLNDSTRTIGEESVDDPECIQQMNEEIKNLNSQVTYLNEKVKTVNKENDDLKKELRKNVLENEKLNSTIKCLTEDRVQLFEEIDNNKNLLESLEIEKNKTFEILRSKIEKLKNENIELQQEIEELRVYEPINSSMTHNLNDEISCLSQRSSKEYEPFYILQKHSEYNGLDSKNQPKTYLNNTDSDINEKKFTKSQCSECNYLKKQLQKYQNSSRELNKMIKITQEQFESIKKKFSPSTLMNEIDRLKNDKKMLEACIKELKSQVIIEDVNNLKTKFSKNQFTVDTEIIFGTTKMQILEKINEDKEIKQENLRSARKNNYLRKRNIGSWGYDLLSVSGLSST